jgi:hypothetical protein
VVPDNATAPDVHVHAHRADLAGNPGSRADSASKSARAPGDAPARAVPHLHLVEQEDPAEKISARRGGGETEAALAALAQAADASDWAREPMTPVAAAQQIAPAKGEAGKNWIVWTAMTLAGLARFILVSLGYLVARGGETRIRAGVVTGVLVAAIVIGSLAGHSA